MVPSVSTSFAIRAALRTRSVTEMILSIQEAYYKHVSLTTKSLPPHSESRDPLAKPRDGIHAGVDAPIVEERAFRGDGDLVKLGGLRESAAVLAELKTWLCERSKTLSIGTAAGYVLANWDRLTRFVDDPRIPRSTRPRELAGAIFEEHDHFLHRHGSDHARQLCYLPHEQQPAREPESV